MYSPNVQYYGALHNQAHMMLGRQGDPHGKFAMPPGVMEHFETATRDPAFFRLHKYMDNIFKEHKDLFAPYTQEELTFPGISVDKFEIEGELKTYFEDFEFDLNNAVDHPEDSEEMSITASVSRLNHEPFSYNIDVLNNNDQEVLSTLRIYLCPIADNRGLNYTYDEARWHCIEMDKFFKKLSPGANHVVRKSSESSVTVPDVPSFHTLIDQTDEAVANGNELNMSGFERACGIPNRMLLPKGWGHGMQFTMDVYVTDGENDWNIEAGDFDEVEGSHSHCGVQGKPYPDRRPLGYPLDRRIEDNRIFDNTVNFKAIPVKVFHDPNHRH